MVRKTDVKMVEGLRGGKGTAEVHHIVTAEELRGHGKMYAKVVLAPHSSVGYHQHVGDTEPYYILSGHGVFIDNDGSRIPVGPEDVCIIECGQSHGMENDSDEELVMMALVYNE